MKQVDVRDSQKENDMRKQHLLKSETSLQLRFKCKQFLQYNFYII